MVLIRFNVMLKLTWNFLYEFTTFPNYLQTLSESDNFIFQGIKIIIYEVLEKVLFDPTLAQTIKAGGN